MTVTVAPHGCPCSIWDTARCPPTVGNNNNGTIDYGVKFRSDVDGDVTGFRFYKSPGETGTHTGHLWDRNGTLLGERDVHGREQLGMAAGDARVADLDHREHDVHQLDLLARTGSIPTNNFYFASNGVDNSAAPRARGGSRRRQRRLPRGSQRCVPRPELPVEQLLGRRRLLERPGHDARP